MDAVCANDNVGGSGSAVVESHFDTVPILGQSDTSMVKMKHAVWHCRGKNVEQFGSMEMIIGGAEVTLAGPGQRLMGDHVPVGPPADHGRVRSHSESAQRLLKSEPMEDSSCIGTYLDAGANLAQFGGLFEELNLEAGALKRQRSHEATYPSANHYDSHVSEHLPFVRIALCSAVPESLSYEGFRSKAFRLQPRRLTRPGRKREATATGGKTRFISFTSDPSLGTAFLRSSCGWLSV
jgi:hypothetical protein